jgi:hypothetical protein
MNGMTWTAFCLILVMAIAASKVARRSLTMAVAIASILGLVWFLAGRDGEPRDVGAHASLTTHAVP